MQCLHEKYIPDYLQLELSEKLLKDFESHLAECSKCQEELESFSAIHQILRAKSRPKPQKGLLKSYRKELLSLFAKEPKIVAWKRTVFDLWERAFSARRGVVRLAQALALVVFGVFVGRLFYNPQGPANELLSSSFQPTFSAIDQEFLQKYFVETEILLLGIENNTASEIELDDVKINQEIAKRLLFQTLHIQQATMQVTDESLLNYLTSLELLLLEISNAENNEIIQAFNDVRNIVKQTDLLQSSRTIQQKVNLQLLNDI